MNLNYRLIPTPIPENGERIRVSPRNAETLVNRLLESEREALNKRIEEAAAEAERQETDRQLQLRRNKEITLLKLMADNYRRNRDRNAEDIRNYLDKVTFSNPELRSYYQREAPENQKINHDPESLQYVKDRHPDLYKKLEQEKNIDQHIVGIEQKLKALENGETIPGDFNNLLDEEREKVKAAGQSAANKIKADAFGDAWARLIITGDERPSRPTVAYDTADLNLNYRDPKVRSALILLDKLSRENQKQQLELTRTAAKSLEKRREEAAKIALGAMKTSSEAYLRDNFNVDDHNVKAMLGELELAAAGNPQFADREYRKRWIDDYARRNRLNYNTPEDLSSRNEYLNSAVLGYSGLSDDDIETANSQLRDQRMREYEINDVLNSIAEYGNIKNAKTAALKNFRERLNQFLGENNEKYGDIADLGLYTPAMFARDSVVQELALRELAEKYGISEDDISSVAPTKYNLEGIDYSKSSETIKKLQRELEAMRQAVKRDEQELESFMRSGNRYSYGYGSGSGFDYNAIQDTRRRLRQNKEKVNHMNELMTLIKIAKKRQDDLNKYKQFSVLKVK